MAIRDRPKLRNLILPFADLGAFGAVSDYPTLFEDVGVALTVPMLQTPNGIRVWQGNKNGAANVAVDASAGNVPVQLYGPNNQPIAPANPAAVRLYDAAGNTYTESNGGIPISFATPTNGGNIVASTTQTTSGSSGDLAAPAGADQYLFLFHVTAASGTGPQLTFAIRAKMSDAGYVWIGQTAQLTGVTSAAIVMGIGGYPPNASSGAGPFLTPTYQIYWLIAGTTPSFTFVADLYWR